MRIILFVLILFILYVYFTDTSKKDILDYRYNIQLLVQQERYIEAQKEIEYFSEFDPSLKEEFFIVEEQLNSYSYFGKQVFIGLFGGDSNNIQITSNVLVSFFVIGDLIDFSRESYNLVTDNEADMFILSLSTLGIVSTISLPAKPGFNFIKILYKARFLPKWFIEAVISKTLNIEIFKKISSSIKEIGCFNTARIIKYSSSEGGLNRLFNLSGILKEDIGVYLKYAKPVTITVTDRLLLKLSTISNKFSNLFNKAGSISPERIKQIILFERSVKAAYKATSFVDINKFITENIAILLIIFVFLFCLSFLKQT